MACPVEVYAAWVRHIEIGLNEWSDETNEIETPMLARFPLKGRVQTKKEGLKDQNTAWLLVGFVALRPKSTAMVIAGRSVHLTTLFPGQA